MPKERGRPGRKYPPRIDATAEQLAKAMLSLPPDHQWEYMKPGADTAYRCAACGREVSYPETLYNDGRCEGCHAAAVG